MHSKCLFSFFGLRLSADSSLPTQQTLRLFLVCFHDACKFILKETFVLSPLSFFDVCSSGMVCLFFEVSGERTNLSILLDINRCDIARYLYSLLGRERKLSHGSRQDKGSVVSGVGAQNWLLNIVLTRGRGSFSWYCSRAWPSCQRPCVLAVQATVPFWC